MGVELEEAEAGAGVVEAVVEGDGDEGFTVTAE